MQRMQRIAHRERITVRRTTVALIVARESGRRLAIGANVCVGDL